MLVLSLARVCREVARLVGEVGYIRQMMDVLEEKESGVTGDQVARLEVTEEK